jgi:hypothetical protein
MIRAPRSSGCALGQSRSFTSDLATPVSLLFRLQQFSVSNGGNATNKAEVNVHPRGFDLESRMFVFECSQGGARYRLHQIVNANGFRNPVVCHGTPPVGSTVSQPVPRAYGGVHFTRLRSQAVHALSLKGLKEASCTASLLIAQTTLWQAGYRPVHEAGADVCGEACKQGRKGEAR